MPRYKIKYFSERAKTVCSIEMERSRFTKREWKYALDIAIALSSDSDCSNLAIYVFRDGKFVFEGKLETDYPANALSPGISYLYINRKLQRIFWRFTGNRKKEVIQ